MQFLIFAVYWSAELAEAAKCNSTRHDHAVDFAPMLRNLTRKKLVLESSSVPN
jgi:hypothetical protein